MSRQDLCRQTCELRRTLPAKLDEAERFILEFRARCRCLMETAETYVAELLVREAVTNAVVHGSGGDPTRQVRCVLRMRPGQFTLSVADEGEGFDWRRAWTHEAADTACSGRGMEILRKYATRVRFSSKGNVTTIWKRF